MSSLTRSAPLAVVVLAAAALAAPIPASADPIDTITQNREVFSPDGTITRVDVTIPVNDSPAPAAQVRTAAVTPIIYNGPTDQKLDIVVVGDGYTAGELGVYAEHANSKIAELFSVEPYHSYADQFNVWMVDVVSNESGVDNDPLGVNRDTALDMYFYCGGLDRLLCVNETKANQYAAQAPDVDQVLALANTGTYGGAGGGVATSAGGNPSSGQIVVHELGHSIGGLADEYDYADGDTYTGPELFEPNVSIKDEATQQAEQVKWWQWMGQPTPDGGVIGTFDGARYWLHGIHRPSQDSIMRTLGREFNLVGREAMVAAFHDHAAVAGSSIPDGAVVTTEALPTVILPDTPGGHRIVWWVDGQEITGAAGETTLDPRLLDDIDDPHRIRATVVDTTDWVRDPVLRAQRLTVSFHWTLP